MSAPWTCPVCGDALDRLERVFRCPNGHSFDLAREGYVNLLLAQQKRSRDPGDSAEMVRSRSRFLDRGHYAPLAERLVGIIAALESVDGLGRAAPRSAVERRPTRSLPTDRSANSSDPVPPGSPAPEALQILDSGCGEGYFLARLREGLAERGIASRPRGIDISRPAVRAAARRDPRLHLAVASVHHLPIAAASLDLVLRVLAPIDAAEFRRVLKPGGRLLSVTPGPDHLLALRRLVYKDPRSRSDEPPPEGFDLLQQDRLSFPLRLDGPEEVSDLLAMTPYYWHADEATREAIVRCGFLETTADFVVSTYALAACTGAPEMVARQ